jgi:hypothetical protein
MNIYEPAQSAYDFLNQLKVEILRQVNHLNAIADGELQDGYNTTFLEDGWVTLKGCSWGFVMHYDEPARIDMTFGPDQPFVGHRITFISQANGSTMTWTNKERTEEVFRDKEQLARYGLRRLAGKVGDGWLFDNALMQMPVANLESYSSESLSAPSYFAGVEQLEP